MLAGKHGADRMPKGPKGEKRPADVIGNAVRVMRIATGEEAETSSPASPAGEMGRKGGKARAEAMTPERRAEVARNAASKRWGIGRVAPATKEPV